MRRARGAEARRLGGTEEEADMDALQLLKTDHDSLKKLLHEADETTERAVKGRTALLQRIHRDLSAHEAIEEEIFYPALKAHPKAKDLVLEAYEEHDVVDTIMGELEATDVSDERWGAKFKVMMENIEHHIEEEEGEMFAKATSAFSTDELEELGRRMAERKESALAQAG
jgi:hemerythrin-like domain-containing protein